MQTQQDTLLSKILFYVAITLIVYMPLHVFLSQSLSLITGGIEVWKAAKDIFVVLLVPVLLYLSYKRNLFKNQTFRWLIILGGCYTLLHGLFVLFDQNDDTYSAIVASVYNTRLFGYVLLGYLIGAATLGKKHLKYLLTAAVLVAFFVSVFGILQYFLPSDLLANVGYSLERGVKPMFFIDDRPELPRIMSTVKDPNSLGAYLIVPILLVGVALFRKHINEMFFYRPFRKEVLVVMLGCMLLALFLTFSRGALIGMILSALTVIGMVAGEKLQHWARKYWYVIVMLLIFSVISVATFRNTAIVQDYVFHAAVSSNEEDPNQKRVTLVRDAVNDVIDNPEGSGPGSAGLVAITNPKGGVLTENYYLQIAYEVGWLGITLLVAIISIIAIRLSKISRVSPIAVVLFSALIAYLFYSLLIHLWSNETVALQWWLLTGTVLGADVLYKKKI